MRNIDSAKERDTEGLWRAYKIGADLEAREELISRYAGLVKYVAGRLAINLPRNVEEGDLVGYGSIGLIDAIERFDLLRGVKFETYAIARIRGAMIDGLRAMDWVPVSVRHRNKVLETTIKDLENRLGRSASDQEIAQELKVSKEEYDQRIKDMASTSILSLEDVWGRADAGDGSVRRIEIKDQSAKDPLEEAEWVSKREILAGSIDQLPDREKLVISLYYFEGLTVKEISRILEVSPSRISQLHTKAVMRMRGYMASAQ